jgi:hypothetical protein
MKATLRRGFHRTSRLTVKRRKPMLGWILLIILVLLLLGALPVWPYSGGWGYWPGGLVGLLLIIVIVLLILGVF